MTDITTTFFDGFDGAQLALHRVAGSEADNGGQGAP
jgi:hypothetical protein